MTDAREGGRRDDQIRPTTITTGVNRYAEGSALIQAGNTRVMITASIEERVPPFLVGKNRGWVTAEYGMLPRATSTRTQREATRGKPSGRTAEIQRLIGRALRAVVDTTAFADRTIWIDCDVLQADGGTRCASITGAWVALALAFDHYRGHGGILIRPPLTGQVAAVSVGLAGGRPVLDLDYEEDSGAGVDMNIIRTDDGRYIEIQGTAESTPFTREQMDRMMAFADTGIDALIAIQRQAVGDKLAPLLGAA